MGRGSETVGPPKDDPAQLVCSSQEEVDKDPAGPLTSMLPPKYCAYRRETGSPKPSPAIGSMAAARDNLK